jgi:hypothetical protein
MSPRPLGRVVPKLRKMTFSMRTGRALKFVIDTDQML